MNLQPYQTAPHFFRKLQRISPKTAPSSSADELSLGSSSGGLGSSVVNQPFCPRFSPEVSIRTSRYVSDSSSDTHRYKDRLSRDTQEILSTCFYCRRINTTSVGVFQRRRKVNRPEDAGMTSSVFTRPALATRLVFDATTNIIRRAGWRADRRPRSRSFRGAQLTNPRL